MTDRIRTLADDAVNTQRDAFSFWMGQADLGRKQLDSAWDIGRASLEASRDLQVKMFRAWIDAVAPAREPAKA